jgi:hypothetical protein
MAKVLLAKESERKAIRLKHAAQSPMRRATMLKYHISGQYITQKKAVIKVATKVKNFIRSI